MENDNNFDVIIIGSGVAGLTAALYVKRKALRTLVIGEKLGGQIVYAEMIENFPSFKGSGLELVMAIKDQADETGVEFSDSRAVKIDKTLSSKNAGEQGHNIIFQVKTDDDRVYNTKALIIAAGKIPRKLGIPGESEYLGKGVHVCATCDAPLYKGKDVAVVGGGNSAVDAALALARIANKVYIINRSEQCRADEVDIDKMEKYPNIERERKHIPIEIIGEKFVSGLVVENSENKDRKTLPVSGVFIEIGYEVDANLVKGLVELNQWNEIKIDGFGATSHEGIFAAGDVTDVKYKQAIIASGEGAKAALSAYTFVTGDTKGGAAYK